MQTDSSNFSNENLNSNQQRNVSNTVHQIHTKFTFHTANITEIIIELIYCTALPKLRSQLDSHSISSQFIKTRFIKLIENIFINCVANMYTKPKTYNFIRTNIIQFTNIVVRHIILARRFNVMQYRELNMVYDNAHERVWI